MIIERKYEYFWRLLSRDEKVEELYKKACSEGLPEEEAQRAYEFNLENRLFDLQFGCGIRNPQILREGFAKLDAEEPYDNGFSLNDVNDFDILGRSQQLDWGVEEEKPQWPEYALVYRFDGWNHIVKVMKVVQE